jgi:hypothetical protein
MSVTTPVAVENRLRALSRELDDAEREATAAEKAYLTAKAQYEIAFARAVMNADGRNEAVRKANALVAVEAERLELAVAEGQAGAFRSNVFRIQTQVRIAQSISALLKAGMELV